MQKLFSAGIFIVLSLGQVLGATPPPSPDFGFKGSLLGDSLSKWRKRGVPTESFEGVEPICLGDPGAPKKDRRSFAQKTAGVLQCGYSAPDPTFRYWTGGHIGGYEYTAADYYFLNEKLYRIEIIAIIDSQPELLRLLTAKFGNPAIEHGTFLNGLGAAIPVTTFAWHSTSGKMELTVPAIRVDRLTLVISDNAGEAVIRRADQLASPDRDRI